MATSPTMTTGTTGDTATQMKDFAADMAHRASDAASFVGHKAEDVASSLGSGMKSLGGTIRQFAPRDGMLGGAGSVLAECLENTGQFLQEKGLSGACEQATNLVRRNPIPAVLLGLGVGFLLARMTRS